MPVTKAPRAWHRFPHQQRLDRRIAHRAWQRARQRIAHRARQRAKQQCRGTVKGSSSRSIVAGRVRRNPRRPLGVDWIVTDLVPATSTRLSVTWDYRCPFARNACEHLAQAIEGGAGYEIIFVPFALNEMHREDGDPSVFDDPARQRDLVAMLVGIVIRDRYPAQWLTVHKALFALRHDEGGDLRDEALLRSLLENQDIDPDIVFSEIASGWPLAAFRKEHDSAQRDHSVWGVPTFIVGDQAAFVRLMTRPTGDASASRRIIDHIINTLQEFPQLNELKHTSIAN